MRTAAGFSSAAKSPAERVAGPTTATTVWWVPGSTHQAVTFAGAPPGGRRGGPSPPGPRAARPGRTASSSRGRTGAAAASGSRPGPGWRTRRRRGGSGAPCRARGSGDAEDGGYARGPPWSGRVARPTAGAPDARVPTHGRPSVGTCVVVGEPDQPKSGAAQRPLRCPGRMTTRPDPPGPRPGDAVFDLRPDRLRAQGMITSSVTTRPEGPRLAAEVPITDRGGRAPAHFACAASVAGTGRCPLTSRDRRHAGPSP